MNTNTYTITDTTTGATATTDAYGIAESIRPWYPEATDDILTAIDDLENAVRSHAYYGELAAYLGVEVD